MILVTGSEVNPLSADRRNGIHLCRPEGQHETGGSAEQSPNQPKSSRPETHEIAAVSEPSFVDVVVTTPGGQA